MKRVHHSRSPVPQRRLVGIQAPRAEQQNRRIDREALPTHDMRQDVPDAAAVQRWWRAQEPRPWPTQAHCLDAAAQAFQAHAYDEAFAWCLAVLARQSSQPVAWNTLGAIYRRWRVPQAAEECFRRALQARPGYFSPWNNLAYLLTDAGRYTEAEEAARQALAIDPNHPDGWNNLGNLLQRLGRLPESLKAYARALELAPGHRQAFSNYLLAVQYASDLSADAIAEQHRRFAQRFGQDKSVFTDWPACAPEPLRRLRVGYVSPDLRDHSVSYFLEPLVAHHDRRQIQLFAYDCTGKRDSVNARLRTYFAHWRDVALLSDDALCEQIRSDGIDILIDVAGHTAGNRLAVFARKPAPVQLTWLGHPNTTGLSTIDWRLSDWVCDPVGTERRYSERLWRLPDVFCVYRPCVRNPALRDDPRYASAAAPWERNGYVTFGSLNNPGKLNDVVVALWSRIVRQVPGSRLLLESPDFATPEGLQRTRERFAAHGLGAERLLLLTRDVSQQYLRYHDIDIALDPFPTNGGTTTCDILWFGLPVVVLEGDSFVSRMGTGLLRAVGLGQWVVPTPQDYEALALRLAGQPQQLTALRQQVRRATQHSPLMDEVAFARHVDEALRTMWQLWCQGRTDVPATPALTGSTLPGCDLAHRMQAEQALQRGRTEPLQRVVDALLAAHPDDAWAWLQQARIWVCRHDRPQALVACQRAVQQDPTNPAALCILAQLWLDSLNFSEALRAAQQAVNLAPQQVSGWIILSSAALRLGQSSRAEAATRRVMALAPENPNGCLNLAGALHAQGRTDEALLLYRRMMQRWPQHPSAYSNFLLHGLYAPQVPLQEVVDVARRYGQQMQAQAAPWAQPVLVPTQPLPWRRLRVAVVSPDLRNHSVMYFLEPVLATLDRQAFSLQLYNTLAGDDAVTQRARRMCDAYVSAVGMTPQQLAQRLRSDGVDIVLDVAGHTAGGALAALAGRAAPVQVTWLGYPGTTGVPAMDWRLTDAVADMEPQALQEQGLLPQLLAGVPPLAQQYSEQLMFIPPPFCVYRPCIRNPLQRYGRNYQVRPAPALARGVVTFGCCNNLSKLSPQALDTWARILNAVPGSRLLLEGRGLQEEGVRQHWLQQCVRAGIPAQQLDLEVCDPRNQYLTYHRIDIALDPFPLCGGTTSFDALWMGVPLVSMAGSSFRSRMGASLLTAAGLTQWLARNPDEYVHIAVGLARDLPQLNARRLAQRARLEAGPLMDEQRFARLMEHALRRMWLLACAKALQPGATAQQQAQQVSQWLAQCPQEQVRTAWVYLAPGDRISLPEARARLQRALEQFSALSPSAPGSGQAPAWQGLHELATRVLESVPGEPAALVALAEVAHTLGQRDEALSLMAHAWNAAPHSTAVGQRLARWLEEEGRLDAARHVRNMLAERQSS